MMKRVWTACALVVGALVATSGAAFAQSVTLTATLTAGEETPIILSGGVGTAEVTVDPVARELTVALRVFNLATGSAAGHIHIGPKGIAGPVVINFPIPTGQVGDLNLRFRLGQTAFVARPEIGINSLDDAIQSIVGGNSYVNIHTAQYPAGEIRGQLAVSQ
jgi:hypothetical protein